MTVVHRHVVGSFFCIMPTDRDTLIFQKAGGGSTSDLYADFSIKTTSVPLFVPMETKELPYRDWMDEDGEDTYFPSEMKLSAYDSDVDVIYKGATGTFRSKLQSLFDYLKGGELNIYSPYSNTGCKGAYFKGFSDFEFVSDSTGEVAQFKITFRITKPEETFSV